MSDAVTVQLIATIGVVLTALMVLFGTVLTLMSNRTRQHARAASNNTAQTRDQVTNDHKVNLRDDLDAKFATINRRLDTQSRQIQRLFRNDTELKHELEQTLTKPPRKPKE